MRALLLPAALVLVLLALGSPTGRAAPGAITLAVSNSPVGVGDTLAVAVRLSGYTDPTEADGYNFRLLYDPGRFAVVSGSASLHDAAGPDPNWLRFPAQENVGGLSLMDYTAFDPGVVHVSVVDLRLAPDPLNPRGTAAADGFLYALSFTALKPGVGAISVVPAVGGAVLHDPFLSPAGVPDLAGATANVTVTGPRLRIQRAGADQVTITWPAGVLETTDWLGRLWTPVAATNSLTVPATGAQRFYRAILP